MTALTGGTSTAQVSSVADDRLWFKAKIGPADNETSCETASCAHVLLQSDRLFVVLDATLDPRFSDNLLVTQSLNINLYTGTLSDTISSHEPGTLCAVDYR